jgi:ABC-type transporter Mla MlaB component
VRHGEHACCRFAQPEDRDRLAIAFMREGLRRGDKVVYICDREDVEVVAGRLETLDPGFASAMARGQFEIHPAHETYIPDGKFDPNRMVGVVRDAYDNALAEGYAGLSITGEVPEAVCQAQGGMQVSVYEARLHSDHQEQVEVNAPPYSILCQYGHEPPASVILSDIVAAHDVDLPPELAPIGRRGELEAARERSCGALRLSGELDFGSANTVSEVLGRHFEGPLRLDLADLSYVDVAGIRALCAGDRERVIIARASAAVRRMVALLAWDTDPSIEFLEAE